MPSMSRDVTPCLLAASFVVWKKIGKEVTNQWMRKSRLRSGDVKARMRRRAGVKDDTKAGSYHTQGNLGEEQPKGPDQTIGLLQAGLTLKESLK